MTNLPAKLNRRAFLQMASLSLGAVALPTAFINTVIAQQKTTKFPYQYCILSLSVG
ncbi:MAG: twin-arginine translocation signal domain-containing protein [Methylacidiphilales bacterium]|nr:twin-arginine translocation signal domain-containing protein [Candidatus Methylacidiphilales bacterium]